eukprot:PhF_6_TR43518/c0_g1_i1/m.66802
MLEYVGDTEWRITEREELVVRSPSRTLWSWSQPNDPLTSILYLPTEKVVVVGCSSGIIRIFGIENFDYEGYPAHQGEVVDIAIHPWYSFLSGSTDTSVCAWSYNIQSRTLSRVRAWKATSQIQRVGILLDDNQWMISAACRSGHVVVWADKNSQPAFTFPYAPTADPKRILIHLTGIVQEHGSIRLVDQHAIGATFQYLKRKFEYKCPHVLAPRPPTPPPVPEPIHPEPTSLKQKAFNQSTNVEKADRRQWINIQPQAPLPSPPKIAALHAPTSRHADDALVEFLSKSIRRLAIQRLFWGWRNLVLERHKLLMGNSTLKVSLPKSIDLTRLTVFLDATLVLAYPQGLPLLPQDTDVICWVPPHPSTLETTCSQLRQADTSRRIVQCVVRDQNQFLASSRIVIPNITRSVFLETTVTAVPKLDINRTVVCPISWTASDEGEKITGEHMWMFLSMLMEELHTMRCMDTSVALQDTRNISFREEYVPPHGKVDVM